MTRPPLAYPVALAVWLARCLSQWVTSRQDDHVSEACLTHHEYGEDTRGVDLPTWHTPAEVNQMRRQARRAGWHIVGKRQDERKTG